MKIALIDYGAGNLFSVERALKFTGADYYLATKPEQIKLADKLVLPGVGAFADGMTGLKKGHLIQPLLDAVKDNKPLLGICLGMQILMETGHEFGTHKGLGLIPGFVDKIVTKAKLPQIGWNNVKPVKRNHPLLGGIKDNECFYFVHSYVVRPKDKNSFVAATEYGGDVFCSVIQYNNVYGTQFHPEKSGPAGLTIYQNFVRNVRPTA